MLKYLTKRISNVRRAVRQKWSSARSKRKLWNDEYAEGRWESSHDTSGDCVYQFIERYAREGDILDLGSGAGNTATELKSETYQRYMGVDISDVALCEAKRRSAAIGREDKNQFCQGDIGSYQPVKLYDVILFRDSIYYIPFRKVSCLLDRYARHLKPEGVFVVRLYDIKSSAEIIDLIKRRFALLEDYSPPGSSSAVLVFQSRSHR